MNTSQLKRFAQEARTKLITLVSGKLDAVLTQDNASLRGKVTIINKLEQDLEQVGKAQLIDKVAYTWFNRLVALRFMDANDFQPLGINILSPAAGQSIGSPQILNDIHAGIFPEDLKLDREYINNVLNGVLKSNNPDNDIYRHILIAVCNDLHRVFPFLFERIDDYTELLLPDDLTSAFSIVADVVNGMSAEDCQEVEIIGWLYQFYVSDLNETLISSKKVYKKEDLAPASQLFTPKWIVQYMVDNTLGQLLVEQFPHTKIHSTLEYYIQPAYTDKIPARAAKKIEEIQFFEPCVGSGHILAYAYDVFYKIYEEQGYSNSEIPELIIKHNLYGVDIDPRAAQMASLVLMMKGRQSYRRFFRSVEKNNIQPNIYHYADFSDDPKFGNATALGSLIRVSEDEINALQVDSHSLFGETQQKLKNLYSLLGRKYDVVVTNPPYISSSRMEGTLKQYVEKTWPETKSDLFATFILRCLELAKEDGFTGYMTPFVWMFISSYEKLREKLIHNHLLHSLIQLEYSGFDGATVPICTFTLRNQYINEANGSYIRLSDFKGAAVQGPKTLEAIQNPDCGWFYTANQKDFEKIPGGNIGYWLSEKAITNFSSNQISSFAHSFQGLISGNNDKLLRLWFELSSKKQTKDFTSYEQALNVKTFVPYQKGGNFRKWYGNNEYYIFWNGNGKHFTRARFENTKYYFKPCLSWTFLSSSKFGIRKVETGSIWDVAGSSCFPFDVNDSDQLLALLCSKVGKFYLDLVNPTLNFQVENILAVPVLDLIVRDNAIKDLSNENILISKQEWNSRETSWDFAKNELVKHKSVDIASAIESYKAYWSAQFHTLHQNEEELNRQFIEIYGLQEELTPDVPLEDITILKDEAEIVNGALVFKEQELVAQLISYAIGCVFERYSLDQEGLILANQGETLQDYIAKVGTSTSQFLPDEDNVIPVLEEEWFDDDIVNRVKEFVRVVWGDASYSQNLQYIEEALGKDLRKYLTKDFYKDHIKRYKKRPIYWLFSSPKGHFSVLIYMHRYTQDTLNLILNEYLRPFMKKVENDLLRQEQIIISGSAAEQGHARKRQTKLNDILKDCIDYERDILFPLAGERIAIDLDEGVLVNYNKFGKAIAAVAGLNDAKTKQKVKEFDWIDRDTIR